MSPKVNAVVNAHQILKYLSDQTEPRSVTQIARATNISASSSFNILKTMVELRLVIFRNDTKLYELGPGVFELARNGMSSRQILADAQPILTELAERHLGLSGLWEIINGDRVIVAMGKSSTPARLNIHVGQTYPIGAGSAGRAFMSRHHEDVGHLERAFNDVQWRGQITFEQYHRDVKRAARDGYAIDRDTLFPGVTTISSAFFEPRTHREFCVSVFLISRAQKAGSLKGIANDVLAASRKLGDNSSAEQPIFGG